ncbi:hypothetical protein MKW92_007346 [Papaver armeniacum]|nr:hypothetical protein MKW92_007346 [Papaver armeniacum]
MLQRSGGKSSRMREIIIENLRGTTMKIALWGSAANQVGNDPIDCDSIPRPVLVVVCSTFVKNYLESNSGRITISSKNATKVCADADIPEVVEMRERCPYARPSRHITVPIKKGKVPIHIDHDRKTISQLPKWDPTCQTANVLICSATATHVLIENGWHYLACTRCSKKVMGDNGHLWCTKCEFKVELPIARFMVRFEVEDHTGTTVFVALDSEVQKLVLSTAAELIGASEVKRRTLFSQK